MCPHTHTLRLFTLRTDGQNVRIGRLRKQRKEKDENYDVQEAARESRRSRSLVF